MEATGKIETVDVHSAEHSRPSIAVEKLGDLPPLTGLRFFAAFFVFMGHATPMMLKFTPSPQLVINVTNCLIEAPLKDMARRHTVSWERGRCPRAGLQSAPGRLGYQSPGITTGTGGASLDWDRRRRVTPVQTASQEAWPEAEPLG